MDDDATTDDAELVRQCLSGEREAFEVLVRRYQDAVYGLAYRMTGRAADAEDLAQEAFVRAYRKLASYRPGFSFRNWVMAICANLARNRFRGAARRRRAEEGHLREAERTGAPSPSDPRLARLEEAVARLPEALRLPLVLRHLQGLDYEDIAGVIGTSLSGARMRVKRARDRIAAELCTMPGQGPS